MVRVFVLLTTLCGLLAADTATGQERVVTTPADDIRCGTIRANAVTSKSARAALVRPAPGAYQETSPRVRVHYNDAALAAYAQSVRDAAERTFTVLADTLGFLPPPSDGIAGGDSRTDIYIRPAAIFGPAWGVTVREDLVGAPYDSSYTSWVELSDTLSTSRRQTVTAHEVFHVIQNGYDGFEQASFLEMISTWCEDRVYDDTNLYLEVLPSFFNQPEKSLFSHVYSNVPWMFYLTETYGDDFLVDVMDYCGQTTGPNVRAATDDALATRGGSTFIDELQTFGVWNYFTGARDDGAHYSEGAAWPLMAVEKRSACYPFDRQWTLHPLGRLAANYYFFDGNASTDMMRLQLWLEYYGTNVVTVTRFIGGTASTDRYSYPKFTVVDSVTVSDWVDCDSVLAILQIDTSDQSINNVGMAAYFVSTPTPPSPYVLVLDRDGCRRPFDGVSDDFASRDGEERPFSEAFAPLGIAVVQSDTIPGDLSLCGGIFIIGGFDDTGLTLDGDDITRLNAFMDAGGDVYLEGSRFGEWADPTVGAPTPAQEDFWSRFGCTFVPGAPKAAGNVSDWATVPGPSIGALAFNYATGADSDDYVGSIVPTNADTLALDQDGQVRISVNHGPLGSERVYATVLLGGSRGANAMSSRAAFLSGILNLFDSIVPAMSVVHATIAVTGARVTIEGTLFGYNGEPLRLRGWQGRASHTVDLNVSQTGGEWHFRGYDDPFADPVTYRLTVGASERLLWQQTFAAAAGVSRPLTIVNAYPSPSRGDVTLVLTHDRPTDASVRVYDAAGRLVYETGAHLVAGTSTVSLTEAGGFRPPVSGVYFARVDVRGRSAGRKILILR